MAALRATVLLLAPCNVDLMYVLKKVKTILRSINTYNCHQYYTCLYINLFYLSSEIVLTLNDK